MRRLAFLLAGSCSLYVGGVGPRVQKDSGVEDSGTGIEAGTVPFVPSHTTVMFETTAADLLDPTAIDTDSLAIAFGGATMPPPKGILFAVDGARAVLRVGTLTASLGIRVVGARPLVIVASRTATIGGKIDAAAKLGSPGPGGSSSGNGPGAGDDGIGSGGCAGGGGGASFGDVGGAGGSTKCGGSTAGPAYGSINDFFGGSGGGKGGGGCGGAGGAGGGAIQISSLVSVKIVGGGAIQVGGGGGAGGCGGIGNEDGGGGGGSGGTIFLEAPIVEVSGALAANGGGGGEGGATDFLTARDGQPGSDGTLDITPAPGGTSSMSDRSGGAGGARTAPAQGAMASGTTTGGGGGAVGRIFLRTRGNPASTPSGKISPAPTLDTSL